MRTAGNTVTDLTAGKPGKTLLFFALPMMLSMIFQQLYNVVDSVVAGQFIGVSALAAVGASYPITVLFLGVANGASIGCSVIISQLFGAKRLDKMKSAVSTSVISLLVLGGFLTVLGLVICKPLLMLMNTPQNVFGDSALYLQVYLYGLVFIFLYNVATAAFNAMGNSKTPLYLLIFSSVLNIILDLVFVLVFRWGVAGVAWATFLAQGLASALAIGLLFFKIRKVKTGSYRKFDGRTLNNMLRVAVPSILQQSFISVGQLFVQGLVNGFGEDVIAGYSAAFKINTFIIMSATTLSNAMSSFTAQNMGAGKPERVGEAYRRTVLGYELVVVVIVAVLYCFSRQLVGLFVDSDQGAAAIDVGKQFLYTTAPFYLVVTVKNITDGVLRGSGCLAAFMIGTSADLVLRVAFSYILVAPLGIAGIWWSYPIGWVVGTALSLGFYFTGHWKRKRLV